jgi:hypothetical protein
MGNRNISTLQFGAQGTQALVSSATSHAKRELHFMKEQYESNSKADRKRELDNSNTHSRAMVKTRKTSPTTIKEKVRTPKDATMQRAYAARN